MAIEKETRKIAERRHKDSEGIKEDRENQTGSQF